MRGLDSPTLRRPMVLPVLHSMLETARAAGIRVIRARLASSSVDFGDVVPAVQA